MTQLLIDMCWRWSQLFVAIAVVIVEWVCRGAITIVLSFIPFSERVSGTGKEEVDDDPNCERGTIEYVRAKGYEAEEHFATTADGYVLGLHRIPASVIKDGADEIPESHPRPVLILHGFMHSSEAFTIRQHANDSLPLVLNNAGYDVWLGNNRGNKYSHKHISKKPNTDDYWDFSLDDMVRHDLPTMINYILAQTGAPSLTLLGFSQGTAQGFAYLSQTISPKVNLFVPLAPVIVPRGFANPVVDSLARARPDFIFLLFGKRQMLPSTLFWRAYLPRPILVYLLDFCMKFLFDWDTSCISDKEKALLYSHIYAHASVKTVVQWFQIIQTRKFQMFDDYYKSSSSSSSYQEGDPGYVLPSYQTKQIKTPIACFCGGKDTLPNNTELLAALPKSYTVLAHMVDKYEHLDFMWASDVAELVYPKILEVMAKYNKREEESCVL